MSVNRVDQDMNIRDLTSKQSESRKSQSTGAQLKGQTSDAQTSQTEAAVSTDEVHLTGTAQKIKTIVSKLSSLPAENEARVASIKDAISSGHYQTSNERIANALLNFESHLGAR